MADGVPERRTYTAQEAAYALGIGESKFRALYQAGAIRIVRVGRRVLVPITEVERFLSATQQEATPAYGR